MFKAFYIIGFIFLPLFSIAQINVNNSPGTVIGSGNLVKQSFFDRSSNFQHLNNELNELLEHYDDIPLNNQKRRLEISKKINAKKQEIQEYKDGVTSLFIDLNSIPSESSSTIKEVKKLVTNGKITTALDFLRKDIQSDDSALAHWEGVKKRTAEKYLICAQLEAINTTNDYAIRYNTVTKLFKRSIEIFPYFQNTFSYAKYLYQNRRFGESIWVGQLCLKDYCKNKKDSIATLINIGNAFEMNNQNDEFFSTYQTALNTIKGLSVKDSIKFLNDFSTIYTNMATVLYKRNIKLEDAKSYQFKALLLSTGNNVESSIKRMVAINALGDIYKKLKQYDSAYFQYNNGLQIFNRKLLKASGHSNQVDSLLPYAVSLRVSLGNLYSERNLLDSALFHLNDAKLTYQRLSNENIAEFLPDLAKIYNNIGIVWNKKNNYDSAYFSYSQQLQLLEFLIEGGDTSTYLHLAASSYKNIADLFAKKAKINAKYYDSTKLFLIKSLNLYTELLQKDSTKYLPSKASVMNSFGNMYTGVNNFDSALYCLNDALKNYRTLESSRPEYAFYVANTLMNVGNVYNKMGEKYFDTSINILSESLSKFRVLANKNPQVITPFMVTALNNIGEAYSKKDFDKSLSFFSESDHILEELTRTDSSQYLGKLLEAKTAIANLYFKNNRKEEAIRRAKINISLSPKLRDKELSEFYIESNSVIIKELQPEE